MLRGGELDDGLLWSVEMSRRGGPEMGGCGDVLGG